jgi:hypothetical protein
MIEKEDVNLLVRLFTDIDTAVNLVSWLIPIHLPWRDREALALTPIPVFNGKCIPAQHDSYSMKKVAMLGHSLTRREIQAADMSCPALEEDFIFQVDLLDSRSVG